MREYCICLHLYRKDCEFVHDEQPVFFVVELSMCCLLGVLNITTQHELIFFSFFPYFFVGVRCRCDVFKCAMCFLIGCDRVRTSNNVKFYQVCKTLHSFTQLVKHGEFLKSLCVHILMQNGFHQRPNTSKNSSSKTELTYSKILIVYYYYSIQFYTI